MSTELKAPAGKTRVVGVDLFNHEDYLVGDYDTPEEAFRVSDERNIERKDVMDDVYYVYSDEGRLVRTNTAVSGLGVSP